MFKLDHKGISLPIVLAVTGLIAANSYYFLLVQKDSNVKTAIVRTDLREDAEKRRLLASLSDYRICTQNFGTMSIDTLKQPTTSGLTSIVKNGSTILKVGTNYTNDTGSPSFQDNKAGNTSSLKVGRMYFHELDKVEATDVLPPIEVRYSLVVEYDYLNQNLIQASGKKIVISIPLYVEKDGANKIVKCYSRPDNALSSIGLFDAIRASCQGNSVNSILTTPTQYGCEHLVKTQNCTVTNEFLTGVSINSGNKNAIEFSCGTYTSTALINAICPTTPNQYFAQKIDNSQVTCAMPDPCSGTPGGTLIAKAGGGFYCATKCPSASYVWNSPTTNGAGAPAGTPNCYERTYTCPPGKYAKSIFPDGTADCQDVFFKNISCGANEYATKFDTSTPAAPLGCTAYSRVKNCASGSQFTYMNALNGNPTSSCTTYNY